MAALPYMQFYVAEYLADTAHLDAEEHGAYLLLIFNYWQTGKPIPKKRLQKVARVSNDRWSDVEEALSEFFTDDGESWAHDRIEADLTAVEEAQAQRAAAGKASAEARKSAKRKELKNKSNDRSTTAQRESNDPSTNKEQNREDKNRDKEKNTGPADAEPASDSGKAKKFTDEDFEKFWKFCREHWFGNHGHKADAKKSFSKLKPGKDDLHEILKLTRQECEYRRRAEAAEGFHENMKHVCRWIDIRGWEDVRERLQSGPALSLVANQDSTQVNRPHRAPMPKPDRAPRKPTGTGGDA